MNKQELLIAILQWKQDKMECGYGNDDIETILLSILDEAGFDFSR